MAHFIPVAETLAAPLLNRVCFRLKSLLSASSIVLPERSVSVSVGLVRTFFWTVELEVSQLNRLIVGYRHVPRP